MLSWHKVGMSDPVRLRLSRRKGFNLHSHSLAVNGLPAVNVARPSKWGNPWKVGEKKFNPETGRYKGTKTAVDVVAEYRRWICGPFNSARIARDLRGKNLACWCASDAPCHADILLEVANRPLTGVGLLAPCVLGENRGLCGIA